MSRWYVIFLSGLTVLAVLGIAVAGVYLHHRYPNLLPWSIVAAVGVALASIKALLEVSKLAGELQKAQLEMLKLSLEIEELQHKKEERSAAIVAPTERQIQKFAKVMGALHEPSFSTRVVRSLGNTLYTWWSWIVRLIVRER